MKLKALFAQHAAGITPTATRRRCCALHKEGHKGAGHVPFTLRYKLAIHPHSSNCFFVSSLFCSHLRHPRP
ncbi:hypothetical protein HYQ46_012282 [Verticillium longisporum]|nr:hypothetical protein HYQ46_012282 [Verticillium longisporum]